MTAIVRDWQTDAAHAGKADGRELRTTGDPIWAVPKGIAATGGQRTASWAVRMVLSCQRARLTGAE